MERMELVLRKGSRPAADLKDFSVDEAKKAHAFHAGFAQYAETPLTFLPGLANALGVESIHVKDESYRFGLNAFKVLGGSYALGRYIAKTLGEDIEKLPADRILSQEVREKLDAVSDECFVIGNYLAENHTSEGRGTRI